MIEPIKTGDLAITINTIHPENSGIIVEVGEHLGAFQDTLLFNGTLWYNFDKVDCFKIKSNGREFVFDKIGAINLKESVSSRASLRKISGLTPEEILKISEENYTMENV